MKKTAVFVVLLAMIFIASATDTQAAKAAPKPVPAPTVYTLTSDNVRLVVSETYGYKVIEASTGNTLLSQNQTSLVLGGSLYTSSTIKNVSTTSTSLSGDLTLILPHKPSATAHVKFTFPSIDTLNVSIWFDTTATKPTSITENFIDAGENYYGVWETAYGTGIDNRGISGDFSGLDTTVNGVFAASARAPFYMTSKKIGIYVPTVASGSYKFAVNSATSFTFNSPSLDYTVFYGTPKSILAQYNTKAGASMMPSDWGFSTIWWRNDDHQVSGTPAVNSAALLKLDADDLQANQIPATAMWIDRPYGTGPDSTTVSNWGNLDFDSSFDPMNDTAQYLASKGINILVWIANKANNLLLTEGTQNGYLFNVTDSRPAVDVRKPAAYDWFKASLNTLMDKAILADGSSAIKGYKIDRAGEGEIPTAAINETVTAFQKMAREGMQDRHGDDFFIFSRSLDDTSRSYTAAWNGDSQATFLGLTSSIKNGLRAGIMNFPIWGSDTGGYVGTPTEELFARWSGFSAYSPMMEVLQGPGRNLFYGYASSTVQIIGDNVRAHQDMIPYSRSLAYEATQDGTPIMRAMMLEFPTDTNTSNMWNEYMYGPNLLVAPVITSGATSQSVYLPAGRWMDYNNRSTIYSGGQTVTMAAPISTIPVLVREGSIIPRGNIVKGNNNWTPNWSPSLRLEIFAGHTASSFTYWTGSSAQTISATPTSDGFDISLSDLGLPGEIDVYTTLPTSVVVNGATLDPSAWSYDSSKQLLIVPFSSGINDIQIIGATTLF